MIIDVRTNYPQVAAAMRECERQVPYALMLALNKTAQKAQTQLRTEMRTIFDRPTPWVLNSLKIKWATKVMLSATLQYKNNDSTNASSGYNMIEPHVFGGKRHFKAMEARLFRSGMIPAGYSAVPGAAAELDAYGNMSRGQISQLLNVLGTYTESGYSKADLRTVDRLAKGSAKKNVYGFAWWVNRVGSAKGKHLAPGVYKRVSTAFGSSLKPVLMFVKRSQYKRRLNMEGVVNTVQEREFPVEFDRAFDAAKRSAFLKIQSPLL